MATLSISMVQKIVFEVEGDGIDEETEFTSCGITRNGETNVDL